MATDSLTPTEQKAEKARREQARKLAPIFAELTTANSRNTYDLGGAYNLVITTELWSSWPRSVKDKRQNRKTSKRLQFGYDSFEEWSWNETGRRGGRARVLAARYRRFKALGLPESDSALFETLMNIGVGKTDLVLRAALRFLDEGAEPEHQPKALKMANRYANTVSKQQMTETQTKALIEATEAEELSIPEMRPPALPIRRVPVGRPHGWAALDDTLVEVSHHAASLDKSQVIDALMRALKLAREVRG